MSCPLCKEERYLTLKNYLVSELATKWKDAYGFDPFESYRHVDVLKKFLCVECGLTYFSPAMYGDAVFYSTLSRFAWYYESDKWEYEKALFLIRKYRPKTLLELGCGTGQFLEKAQSGLEHVLGLDINETALESARKRGLNVRNSKIDEIQQKFDMTVMFQVLEHLDNPDHVLKQVIDRLVPGGILIIAVPNPDGYLKEINAAVLDMPPHHSTGWSRNTFDWVARTLGMEVVDYEMESIRYDHFHGYLQSIVKQSTQQRAFRFMQSVIAKLFLPALFVNRSRHIAGQTHLVVLKKK